MTKEAIYAFIAAIDVVRLGPEGDGKKRAVLAPIPGLPLPGFLFGGGQNIKVRCGEHADFTDMHGVNALITQ